MAEAGWLQEELALLERLLDLTHQIDHTLQSEDFLSVGDLLTSREKILTKISECAERERSVRRGLRKGTDERVTLGLFDEIKTLYEKIAGVEQKIKARLESEKDRVHQKMLSAQDTHRVLRGYAPHRIGLPRFFDKKG